MIEGGSGVTTHVKGDDGGWRRFSGWPCATWFSGCRESRKIVLIVVAIALLLDNMLLTTVDARANKNIYRFKSYDLKGLFVNLIVLKTTWKPAAMSGIIRHKPFTTESIFFVQHPHLTKFLCSI
ncbi:hypothetical protein Ocin01_11001 [Orchesella cincta]|uniref:Uncharacterized protein n=1 Tax=Orchesella cincta TaxID=48709 RepID=A0A1D2MRF5_ORCCI|nr:hypothetical protein Ocin01_11001 [Orchesella cincta]